MSKKSRKQQRRARREQSPGRELSSPTWLATIKTGTGMGHEEHDDCPICRAMGLDLDKMPDVDLRPIESDRELFELLALFEAINADSRD